MARPAPARAARAAPAARSAAAAVFAAERPRLVGLAYRMLGSRDDAEDVVQDAWVRWDRAAVTVDNPAAWLTTTVSRLALDRLRVRRRERERYVGPWLPEPVVVDAGEPAGEGPSADPGQRVVRLESLSLGFLHLLERLSPRERVAFVLAEVFDEPHALVGGAVGANATASRQLVARARRKLAGDRPAPARASASPAAMVDAFVAACATGDATALLRLLAPDVVLVSDGGATVHAARRPVVGPHRVARLVGSVSRRIAPGTAVTIEQVNGAPAVVGRRGGVARLVLALDVRGDRIDRVRIVVAPAKLARLDEPLALR